jgi:hypothetical protein
MEIIYKGTLYAAPVVSPTEISGARLYNLATQTYIVAELKGGEDGASDSYGYEMKLTPAMTASIPQGIYNLELFSMDTDNNPIIQAYYENYAKVKESSFTQDYA